MASLILSTTACTKSYKFSPFHSPNLWLFEAILCSSQAADLYIAASKHSKYALVIVVFQRSSERLIEEARQMSQNGSKHLHKEGRTMQ